MTDYSSINGISTTYQSAVNRSQSTLLWLLTPKIAAGFMDQRRKIAFFWVPVVRMIGSSYGRSAVTVNGKFASYTRLNPARVEYRF
jgi:hypothetical protein